MLSVPFSFSSRLVRRTIQLSSSSSRLAFVLHFRRHYLQRHQHDRYGERVEDADHFCFVFESEEEEEKRKRFFFLSLCCFEREGERERE